MNNTERIKLWIMALFTIVVSAGVVAAAVATVLYLVSHV